MVMNPLSPERVDVYEPGYLLVNGPHIQMLTAVDPRPDFPDAVFVDHAGKTLLPGLIDTHVHLPQFAIMGSGSGELLAWLNQYTYPEESRFADADYAERISLLFFDALLANGTTSACVYCSVHEQATDIAFAVAREKGVRAFAGKVMMDRNSPAALQEKTRESIEASIRLYEKWDGAAGGRLRYVFTPRFAGSCSMELMNEVGRFAHAQNVRIQSHLSENRAEVEWIRSLFPDQPSYTNVYATAGLLGERSIMAHCIHLSDDEIALLARTRTSVAFCPWSNQNLRSGTMPYAKLRNTGLRIGLGSDVGAGPSLSMLDQMQIARQTAGISRDAALFLATLGAAEALGIADVVGNFRPGKEADFVVIDAEQRIDEVWIRGAQIRLA
jgi:guanine deaminase